MYGLDTGGTKIELAIFDGELRLQDFWWLPTPKKEYQQLLNTVVHSNLIIQCLGCYFSQLDVVLRSGCHRAWRRFIECIGSLRAY